MNIQLDFDRTIGRMTDDEFFLFASSNRDYKIEREANGQIIINMPTGLKTSNFNTELNGELWFWNKTFKLGVVFDSNGGFTLPDTSVKSPDASWVRKDRWEKLNNKEKNVFGHLVPDFIAEIVSESDSLAQQKKKMIQWRENGVMLGWLIDPNSETTFIYRLGSEKVDEKAFSENLSGEDILPNFEIIISKLI
jgi:Uma2 family endonuclease